MRSPLVVATLVFALVLLPSVFSLTGFCTGHYVERGDNWINGRIQEGDVFEYWCELPQDLEGNRALEIELQYSNARLVDQFFTPRVIYGTSVVIFP